MYNFYARRISKFSASLRTCCISSKISREALFVEQFINCWTTSFGTDRDTGEDEVDDAVESMADAHLLVIDPCAADVCIEVEDRKVFKEEQDNIPFVEVSIESALQEDVVVFIESS